MSALLEADDVQEVLRRLHDRAGKYVWYLTPGGMIHGECEGLTYDPVSAAFDMPMCWEGARKLGREHNLVHWLDMIFALNKTVDSGYDRDLREALLAVCGVKET